MIYIKDLGGDENFHLYAVRKDGGETKDLTPFDKVRVEIVDPLIDHDTDVLIRMNRRKAEIFDVYRVNAASGELKLVAENPGNITGWVTDHEGRVRAATTTDGVSTSLLYRASESEPFKSDGVRYLIQQGIADPKRVCIYGGSYGGYATLAGLAFTPDLYACGVDYVGVSNLFTFMATIPPYWKPYLDTVYEMVGDPIKDKTLLEARSPVFQVDRIKAPLLIAQGAQDPRVKKAESDQMVEALKKRGIDVPYLVKDNEGHGFRNEENRFEFYEAMERFLDKYLH